MSAAEMRTRFYAELDPVLAALRHHKHLFVDFDSALEHARSHVERARHGVEA